MKKGKGADCEAARLGNLPRAQEEYAEAVDAKAGADLDLALKASKKAKAEDARERDTAQAAVEAAKAAVEALEAAERKVQGLPPPPPAAVQAAERALAKAAADLTETEVRRTTARQALSDAEDAAKKAAIDSRLRSRMLPQRKSAERRRDESRERLADARATLSAEESSHRQAEKRRAQAAKKAEKAGKDHVAELDAELAAAVAARKASEAALAKTDGVSDPAAWQTAKEALEAAALREATARHRFNPANAGERADAAFLAEQSKAAWAKQNAALDFRPPDEAMNRRYDGWQRKLTKEEEEAIQFYMNSSFELNSVMRGLPVKARAHVDMNMARKAPRHITAALDKAPPPPPDLFVYRKIYPKGSPAFIRELEKTKPGEVKQFDGFNSTSLEPEAYGWWRPDPEPPYRFEIRPLHGAYIENLKERGLYNQREFLMRAGMHMRYLGTRKRDVRSPDGETRTLTYHQWEEVPDDVQVTAAVGEAVQSVEKPIKKAAEADAKADQAKSKAVWAAVDARPEVRDVRPEDLQPRYQAWQDGLTSEEKSTYSRFSGVPYAQINDFLRGGSPMAGDRVRKLTPETLQNDIDVLDGMLRKAPPPDDLTVYRVLALEGADAEWAKRLQGAKSGEVQRFDGYMPSSTSPGALREKGAVGAPGHYIMEIRPRRGALVTSLSDPADSEYLLPRSSYLRYVGKREVTLRDAKKAEFGPPIKPGDRYTVHQWEEVVPGDAAELKIMSRAEEAARTAAGQKSGQIKAALAADYLDEARRKARTGGEEAVADLRRRVDRQAQARSAVKAAARQSAAEVETAPDPAVEVDWRPRKNMRMFWTSRVEADELKARERYGDWAKKAAKDEDFSAALKELSRGNPAINAMLRRGEVAGDGPTLARQVNALEKQIREAPPVPDDLFVYRKVDLDGAGEEFRTRMRNMQVGDVEQFEGLSTASISPSAYEAATTSMFMEIKPLSGAYTDLLVPGAKDFMLRPNVKLKFVGVSKRRIDRSMWPKAEGPVPPDKDLPRVIVHMFEEVPEPPRTYSPPAVAKPAATKPVVADVDAGEALAAAGAQRKAAEAAAKKVPAKDGAARLDAAEAVAKAARTEEVARQKLVPPSTQEMADAGWLDEAGREVWKTVNTRKVIRPETEAGARYAQWTKGLEAEEVDAFSVYSRFTGPMNTMLRGGKVPRSSGTTRPYLAERAERIQEALDKAPLPPKGLVVYRRGDADAASLKRLEAVKPGDVEKFDGFQSATLDPGEMGGGGYRMEIRPLRGAWLGNTQEGGREFLMGHGTRMRYLGQREKTFLEAGERKTAIFHQWEEVPAVPGVEAAVEKALKAAEAAVLPTARKVAAWDEKASKAAWRAVNRGNEPVEPNRWDLDETYREWSKTWTKEEEAGLRSYESPLFSTINGLLRGETPAASPEDLERAKDAIRRINSLLERAPEADKVPDGLFAYRVVDTWGPVDAPDELRAFGRRMRNAKPGDVQKFDGYTSTSLAPRVILDFPLIRGDYNMEIRVKRGAPTLQPDEEVGGAGEAMQFLMPAGSYLRYIGKREAEYKPLYGGKREKITLHQWEEVVPDDAEDLRAMAVAEHAARKKAGVSEGGLAADYLDENHVKAAAAAGDVLAANACLTATKHRVALAKKAAKK